MCIIKIQGTSDRTRINQPHSGLNYILFNSTNSTGFNKAMQNIIFFKNPFLISEF